MCAALALVLVACSHTDSPEPSGRDLGYITMGMSPVGIVGWEAETGSRSDGPIEANMPASMGVFGYNNDTRSKLGAGEVFYNREVFYLYGPLYPNSGIIGWYQNNDWPYLNPMPWIVTEGGDGVPYKFYAYSPYTDDANVDIANRDYSTFRTFTWRHIPKLSPTDHTVATQIREYESVAVGNPEQPITLEHLFSRLRFCFRLGDKYSDLRIIRLRSMELINLLDLTYTMTVDMTNPATGKTWLSETTGAATLIEVPLYNDQYRDDADNLYTPEYIELSKENNDLYGYQALASAYIFPYEALSGIRLRVHYDVYDREGQLLRENETAENQIALNYESFNASGSIKKLRPGYYYDIKITIEPKYLYKLSDNDTAPDGFVVIPE